MRLPRLSTLVAAIVLASFAPAFAQRGFRESLPDLEAPNAPYDGRFTFARLKYTTAPGGFYYRGLPAWAHGYQRAEDNLLRIVNEVSSMKVRLEQSNLLALDDPELFKYPVAFMTEAGYWTMSDKEALALGAYLKKGGFIIFDDFRDGGRGGNMGWDNFNKQMKRMIPDVRFVDLDPTQPIFHSFFEIDSFSILPQSYDAGPLALRGIYDGNDPARRLIAIINFNTDVSDFWEFSSQGLQLVANGNEAYKLGVNYLVYPLSH